MIQIGAQAYVSSKIIRRAFIFGDLAACAKRLCRRAGNNNPTQLTSQWVDPAASFEQKTITGLLVAAVVENPTNRRIFEDIACNVLALHGIPSTPSYRTIPQASNLTILGGGLNYTALFSAARLAKASNVLAIHQTGTKTNVIYDPGMTWGPDPFWGPGPWGGPFGPDPFWSGWAIPPSITQQNIIESNTELVSVKPAPCCGRALSLR